MKSKIREHRGARVAGGDTAPYLPPVPLYMPEAGWSEWLARLARNVNALGATGITSGGGGTGGGTGDITSVIAGTGLAGGGTTGDVTLSLGIPVAISSGGTGAITATAALTNLGGAPIASPVFTGNPTAPTPATIDNDTSLATTAFVKAQGYASAANYLPLVGGTLSAASNSSTRLGFLTITAPEQPSTTWGIYVPVSYVFGIRDETLGVDRLTIQPTTGRVAVNTLLANRSTLVSPPLFGTPSLYAIGGDDEQPILGGDAYGISLPMLLMRRARGTAALPTAVQAGDGIGVFQFRGYGSTGFASAGRVRLHFIAAENWTDTAQGTYFQIVTTPIGTAVSPTVATISRGLTLGSPGTNAALDNGPGTLVCNANTAPPISLPGAEQVLIQGADGTSLPAKIDLVSFATNCGFNFYRGNNTAASPTAVVSGNIIARMGLAGGYDGTAWQFQTVRLDTVALENWTGTARGTYLQLSTTPPGSTAVTVSMTLGPGVLIGNVGAAPAFPGLLTISRNAVVPTQITVTPLHIVGADGEIETFQTNTWGGGFTFQFIFANGTAAAPTATLFGNQWGYSVWRGYGATAYTTAAARFLLSATQNWTDTAWGCRFSWELTPINSNVRAEYMSLENTGLTVYGTLTAYAATITANDLYLSRTDTSIAWILRPNTVGYKNLNVGCSGGTPLDAFGITALVTNVLGNIVFYNATSAWIDHGNNGVGAPTFTTRTAGTKHIFYGNISATAVDYAIGIAGGTLWYSVPQAAVANTHAWYGGTTAMMSLTNSGLIVGAPTGGNKGVGTINASAVYANGTALTSDARLKRDIEELPDCLELVARIKPQSYRWREGVVPDNLDRRHWGFMAQDVAEAMRDHDFGGHEIGEDGTETLGIGDMIAALWKGVQELSERLHKLEGAA